MGGFDEREGETAHTVGGFDEREGETAHTVGGFDEGVMVRQQYVACCKPFQKQIYYSKWQHSWMCFCDFQGLIFLQIRPYHISGIRLNV